MQCAYCGATLQPGAKVCSQCGAEVAPARPPGAPDASVAEDPIPEAFPYADPSQAVETPPTTPEPEAVTSAPVSFADIAVAAANTAPGDNRANLAIASLVLGVLSLCSAFLGVCGAPVPVIGIILGVISFKSPRHGLALAGILFNAMGLLLGIALTILTIAMGFFSSRSGN
jgi:hypothetical protein